MGLSITIITLNEAYNIEEAILSSLFADEIILLDSYSQDSTVGIALKVGKGKVKVFQEVFKGHGRAKNLAANYASNDWVFNLDADERITDELRISILDFLKNPPSYIARVKRLNFYCERPIFHGGWYPDYNARLYHKEYAQFSTPKLHEELIYLGNDTSKGNIFSLKGDLLHYSFSNIEKQAGKNIYYAKLGSEKLKEMGKISNFILILFKPLSKFFECYIIKCGFLDGFFGFIIAVNAAYSIFLKYVFAYYERFIKSK